MAVDLDALGDGLLDWMATPSADVSGCAEQFADAVEACAADVEPPSLAVAAAAATLETAMASAMASADLATSASSCEAAMAAFAVTVGGGIAPAFVATPPAGSIGLAALLAARPATQAAAVDGWETAIGDWFRSGTAVPSGGGPAVNWS